MKKILCVLLVLFLNIPIVNAQSSKINKIVLHARATYQATNTMIRNKTLKASVSDGAKDYIKNYIYYKCVLSPSKKNPKWLKHQNVEYYFDRSGNLVFIFIYQGKKEERLYLANNVRDSYYDNKQTKIYRYINPKRKIIQSVKGIKASERLHSIVEYGILTRREQEIPHLYRWRDELR